MWQLVAHRVGPIGGRPHRREAFDTSISVWPQENRRAMRCQVCHKTAWLRISNQRVVHIFWAQSKNDENEIESVLRPNYQSLSVALGVVFYWLSWQLSINFLLHIHLISNNISGSSALTLIMFALTLKTYLIGFHSFESTQEWDVSETESKY